MTIKGLIHALKQVKPEVEEREWLVILHTLN